MDSDDERIKIDKLIIRNINIDSVNLDEVIFLVFGVKSIINNCCRS